jgi:hypothetical protein
VLVATLPPPLLGDGGGGGGSCVVVVDGGPNIGDFGDSDLALLDRNGVGEGSKSADDNNGRQHGGYLCRVCFEY